MDNPGVFALAALSVGAASPISGTPLSVTDGLDGMTAVTLIASLQYGSGGSACSAVVQTTLDECATWYDIARFDFTTASAVKKCNLEGLLSVGVGAYAGLASEGVNDGLLGNQLRCVVISTGTYINTTLSVRASVR